MAVKKQTKGIDDNVRPGTVKIDLRVDQHILEELDGEARAMGLNRSAAIKVAISDFLEKRRSRARS